MDTRKLCAHPLGRHFGLLFSIMNLWNRPRKKNFNTPSKFDGLRFKVRRIQKSNKNLAVRPPYAALLPLSIDRF